MRCRTADDLKKICSDLPGTEVRGMNSAIHPSRTKIDDGRGHSLEMAKQIHLGRGGGWNPLSLRKKLMMRTHFQTVADRSEGGDIQHLLLTWKLASIWMIFFWFNQAFICQVWPYSHDETRVLQVVRVRLVVVLQVHTQSKLVQGDARVHLDYEELNLKSCDKEGGVVFQNSLAILEQSFQILWNQTEPEKHFVPSTEAATAPSSRRTTQTWSCKPVHRDS